MRGSGGEKTSRKLHSFWSWFLSKTNKKQEWTTTNSLKNSSPTSDKTNNSEDENLQQQTIPGSHPSVLKQSVNNSFYLQQ